MGVTLMISVMNPSAQTAEVTATSPTTVTFTATVTVDKPPLIGTVMVTLEASASTGWPTTVSPQSIPFKSPGTVQATVTVTVPQQTSSDLIGAIILNGLATYPGGTASATSSATVQVGQYYKCQLNATPTLGTENPQTYDLKITNAGNGNDSFELALVDQAVISKAGLTVTLDKVKTGNLAQGGNETVHVKVSYGAGASSGKHEFSIRATSVGSKTGSNETATKDVVLSIDVQPWKGQAGTTFGLIAVVIIVVVIAVVFLAMKKGKLRLKKKAKEAPKAPSEKKEAVKTDSQKKDPKEK